MAALNYDNITGAMHAYIFIGNNQEELSKNIDDLTKKIGAKILEYPIAKIEDTRSLNNLIRLSFNEPTLILSKNIDDATEEALNAFLKNLEEPQENIFFALTAKNERSVLPTIISRCEIIRVTNKNSKVIDEQKIIEFLESSPSQKLGYFDTIRDRIKAVEFIEGLIFFLHDKKDFNYMEILLKTLSGLKRNGNVNLHLTNLVAQMSNAKH